MNSIFSILLVLFCFFINYNEAQIQLMYADANIEITGIPNVPVLKLQYHQAMMGPNFINLTGPNFIGRVTFAPDITGCAPLPTLDHMGLPYAGSIVFAMRGGCTTYPKVYNTQTAGAIAMVQWGCNTGPENANLPRAASSYCAAERQPMWDLNAANPGRPFLTIPSCFVSFNVALQAYNAYKANNTLMVSIPATGPLIDQDEKIGLIAISKSIFLDPLQNQRNTTYVQDYWKNPTDPCVGPRVAHFICVAGTVSTLESGYRPTRGTIPPEVNYLKGLRYLMFVSSAITGTVPDIVNNTQLVAYSWGNNGLISGLSSSVANMPNLIQFECSNNIITSLPSDLYLLTKLEFFWAANNRITILPLISSPMLKVLDVSINQMNYPVQDWSNKPLVEQINLAYNKFYSFNVSMLFNNMTSLTSLNLQSNNISGPLPLFWGCSNLNSIILSYNSFSGPVPESWNNLPLLKTVDISNNQVTGPFNFRLTSLTDFDASYNRIDPTAAPWSLGAWSNFFSGAFPASIRNINLRANLLRGAWSQTNYVGILNNMARLILSDNQITSLPSDLFGAPALPNVFTILDMRNNSLAGDLPNSDFPKKTIEGLLFQNNPRLKAASGDVPSWVTKTTPFLKYGTEPFVCPTLVGNGGLILTMSVDGSFYNYKGCVCDRGYYGQPPNCQDIPYVVNVNNTRTFSDNEYGSNRLMSGVSIAWVLKWNSPQIVAAYDVNLYIDPSNFRQFEDVIEIYEGDQSLSGKKISLIRGTDANVPSSTMIRVLDKQATLVFNSKKLSGLHFSSNYSVSYVCPEKYEFDSTMKCQKKFELSVGIQSAVYAIISVFTILILGVTYVVVKKRNSLIIRSASFPFCFAMLIFMTVLSGGSIFYALSPELGDFVCHCRVWFTSFPLVAILGALLVKADRIRKIFNTKELVVQAISNQQLFQVMGLMLLAESALLIAFSGSGMTASFAKIGSGTTADTLVYLCRSFADSNQGDQAFSAWIGIQMGYIALFLVAAVVEAWGVRKVPSAFNEGPQIASCLLSLAVLLIILIPVNFLVDDNPNALMIIRGLGQALVTIVMTFFLFGSKLYLILEGRENDKALSSVASSKSSSSSSSSFSSSSSADSAKPAMNSTQMLEVVKQIVKAVESKSTDFTPLNNSVQTFKSSNASIPETFEIVSQVDKIKESILKAATPSS